VAHHQTNGLPVVLSVINHLTIIDGSKLVIATVTYVSRLNPHCAIWRFAYLASQTLLVSSELLTKVEQKLDNNSGIKRINHYHIEMERI
jgi:hypothetical protein